MSRHEALPAPGSGRPPASGGRGPRESRPEVASGDVRCTSLPPAMFTLGVLAKRPAAPFVRTSLMYSAITLSLRHLLLGRLFSTFLQAAENSS